MFVTLERENCFLFKTMINLSVFYVEILFTIIGVRMVLIKSDIHLMAQPFALVAINYEGYGEP